MKILLAYATNSGSTFLVAQQLQMAGQSAGHQIDVQEIRTIQPDAFGGYDLVIWGSPSWDENGMEGQPHNDFAQFIRDHGSIDFGAKKFAVFGLGDKTYHFFCGAVDHLEKFIKEHNGQLVGESLRIDRFFNDQAGATQQADNWMKQVVAAGQ